MCRKNNKVGIQNEVFQRKLYFSHPELKPFGAPYPDIIVPSAPEFLPRVHAGVTCHLQAGAMLTKHDELADRAAIVTFPYPIER